jgi:hypothetical protein
MRRALLLALAAGLCGVLAPTALAAPGVTTVELTAPRAQRAQASSGSTRFTLVGIHWRGAGRVLFRTRSLEERWTAWRDAAPEPEDLPDPHSGEASRRPGWRIGNPWWVGPSDRVETRAVGEVTRVRAILVWSPESRVPYRSPAATGAPPIVPRASWGADESIRKGAPSYAPSVRFAVVHHTAGRNDYSRTEAPAVVRAIQLYHVRGNGWNDIGYNLLVDRFGTIYEGRYGGIERNVVGAHALGFNTGSVGVALLGTHGATAPSRAAQDALARLLAWRLDLAHVDPTGFTTVISSGSERYGSGIPVLLRNVSGHRDTGFTECPGDQLYSRLNALAAAANGIGLPKLYEPSAETRGPLTRFRARLSSSLAWTVAVTDASGAEVARGTGAGPRVDWSWDSTGAPAGRYAWTIAAGSARPATGTIRVGGSAAPPALEELSLQPEAISPNGDGQNDAATLSYRLTVAMNVTVDVRDAAGGVVATLADRVWTPAGRQTQAVAGEGLPDGSYQVVVTARTASGAELQGVAPLTVSRTLGLVTVTPDAFSPNGDGRRDVLRIGFSLAAPAEVAVRILRDGRWIASPLSGSLEAGPHEAVWDGARTGGRIRDGAYSATVEARDPLGAIALSVPFVSDTSPPRLEIVPARRLLLRVSEPAVLALRVDGTRTRRAVLRAGVLWIRGAMRARSVRVVAWDEAGNRSPELRRVARPARSGARQ